MLKGEEEIDVNKINRERSMATVDDEEHAVLDRLTFDYHQKLQGKPQSHEMVSTKFSDIASISQCICKRFCQQSRDPAIHLNRLKH